MLQQSVGALGSGHFMVAGGNSLAMAGALLSNRELPLRTQLTEAGMLFWRAYAASDLWPRALREQAEPVIRQLLSLGPIGQTVATMSDAAVERLCQDLAHFVRVAQRFDERHAA